MATCAIAKSCMTHTGHTPCLDRLHRGCGWKMRAEEQDRPQTSAKPEPPQQGRHCPVACATACPQDAAEGPGSTTGSSYGELRCTQASSWACASCRSLGRKALGPAGHFPFATSKPSKTEVQYLSQHHLSCAECAAPPNISGPVRSCLHTRLHCTHGAHAKKMGYLSPQIPAAHLL